MNNKASPELLAPAGDFRCFEAALSAGADAVYFGASGFNARAFAAGFSDDEIKRAFYLAALYEKKIYITLNTLLFDREISGALKTAEDLIAVGADTFIVQDLGLASALKKEFPDVILHASTQMTCTTLGALRELSRLGFSRAVLSRELPEEDLRYVASRSPIETEYFVHGALCVSVSGQCLFSSVIGKRSGNRGECAQPCRMTYGVTGRDENGGILTGKEKYPLSLKDNFLGGRLRALCGTGVTSLKIEGRMKSPEYVFGTVKAYRRALDERRDVTPSEKEELAALFSRSGFTSGYYDGRPGAAMLGVRTDKDKENTAASEKALAPEQKPYPKIPAAIAFRMDSSGSVLTMESRGETSTVRGGPPDAALTRAVTESEISSALSKLGNTPFECASCDVKTDGDFIVSRSAINAMRRECAEELEKKLARIKVIERAALPENTEEKKLPAKAKETAIRFVFEKAGESAIPVIKELPARAGRRTEIFLPVSSPGSVFDAALNAGYGTVGIRWVPYYFDSEKSCALALAEKAMKRGAEDILIENLGDIGLFAGKKLHGGERLNVTDSLSAAVYFDLGLRGVTLSREIPERSAPYVGAGIISGERELERCAIAYGYAPLMLLQHCVFADSFGCGKKTPWETCGKTAFLRDRTGASFFTMSAFGHRNVLYNSLPTLRRSAMGSNFDSALFTVTRETKAEIFRALSLLLGETAPAAGNNTEFTAR